ncbi:MAG: cytochrome ubiquinol oxidase subunit I, partial [Bacteroidales bacterium]
AQEKMVRGKAALEALRDYKQAKNEGKLELAEVHRAALEENYLYFGYGFVQDENQLVPNVPIVFYAFRFMVILGSALLLMFLHYCYREYKNKYRGTMVKLVHYGAVLAIPISYLVTQAGWVVAEVGRQPWVIQDIMPTFAAISKIEASSVITTFTLFCILFTTMLIAELGIIYKHIKKGY